MSRSAAQLALLIPLATLGVMGVGKAALAQTATAPQTLAQCIKDLRWQGYFTDQAATDCVSVLQGKPPAETLGQCIANLRSQGFFSTQAAQYCEQALSSLDTRDPYFTYPKRFKYRSSEFAACVEQQLYVTRRVCIDVWGRVDPGCVFGNQPGSSIRIIRQATGISVDTARHICSY